MKTIKLDKESKSVYDVEHVNLPALLLKGVGRYCEAIGCNKHVFGYKSKRFCSKKCRWKTDAHKYAKLPADEKKNLHCNLSLTLNLKPRPHFILSVYLIKGQRTFIPIFPEYKELWDLAKKYATYRNVKSQELLA